MEISEELVRKVKEFIPRESLTNIRQTLLKLANSNSINSEDSDILVGLAWVIGSYLANPSNDDNKELLYQQAIELLNQTEPSNFASHLWQQWLEKRDPNLESFLLSKRNVAAYWSPKTWTYSSYWLEKPLLTLSYKVLSLDELKSNFEGLNFSSLIEAAYNDRDQKIRQGARELLLALSDEVLQNNVRYIRYYWGDCTIIDFSLHCADTVANGENTNSEEASLLAKLMVCLRCYKHRPKTEKYGYSDEQRVIDYACTKWLKSRSTFLAQLIVEQKWIADKTNYHFEHLVQANQCKVFSALKCNEVEQIDLNDYLEVEALVTACKDLDPEIAERANALLKKVPKERTDTIARLWTEQRLPQLFEWLAASPQVPSKPLEIRLLVALKQGKDSIVNTTVSKRLKELKSKEVEAEEALTILVQVCNHSDTTIRENARKLLPQFVQPEYAKLLCRLVIENDWPLLQKLVLEAALTPDNNLQLALFYFVTDQWERYEQLDFDYRLLQKAYNDAGVGSKLRRRLAAKIRQMGRSDLFDLLVIKENNNNGLARLHLTQTLSEEEAEALLQTLAANQDWPQLYTALFELPLPQSIKAVRQLAAVRWQPSRIEERETLQQLQTLVRNEILTDSALPLTEQLPLVAIYSQPFLAGVTAIHCVAFSPSNTTLAITVEKDGQSQILLWDLAKDELQPEVIAGFKGTVSNTAFASETKLVFTTKTRNSFSNVYTWQRSEPLKLIGQQRGTISTLVVLNEHQFLTNGRNRPIVLWDDSRENPQISVSNSERVWSRFICLLTFQQDQEKTAWITALDDGIATFRLPELQLITHRTFSSYYNPKAQAAGLAPDGQCVIFSRNSMKLGFCEFDDAGNFSFQHTYFGKEISSVNPVRVISSLAELPLFVTAQVDGTFTLYWWPSCDSYAQLNLSAGNTVKLKQLSLSSDGSLMATINSDNKLTLWDLRSIPIQLYLAHRPLGPNGSSLLLTNLTKLQLQTDKLKLTQAVRNGLKFMELMLRYRLRHTIELDEITDAFQQNEFDIELADLASS